MIYTLFVWTVVAAYSSNGHGDPGKAYYDWRSIAVVEPTIAGNTLEKCENIARELGIPRERYRCIRTK